MLGNRISTYLFGGGQFNTKQIVYKYIFLKLLFGNLMRRTDSFEKTLMLGNIEGGRRPGRVCRGAGRKSSALCLYRAALGFSQKRLFSDGAAGGFYMACGGAPCRACGGVSSVAQLCPTLCNPMDCSTPGLPVHHQLPKFTQTHVQT